MPKKTSSKNTGSRFSNGSAAQSGSKSPASRSKGLLSTSNTSRSRQTTLRKIFEKELNDIYNAEKQLLEALPQMARAADNEDLQEAFEFHTKQTQKHVERLEKVFERLQIEPKEETCEAMEGLIKEGKEIISEFDRSAARDSALIIGAQKVEHYEIASYGSLCELADVMGLHKVCDILDRTLQEEEETDQLLTEIAEEVNDEAAETGGWYQAEEEENEVYANEEEEEQETI